MGDDILTALIRNGGIVAALTLLYFIIKLFMNGKGKKDNGNNTQLAMPAYIDAIKRTLGRIEDLHIWHAPDAAGKQEWKNPDLANAINKLSLSIDNQTELNSKNTTEQTKVLHAMCVLLEKNTGKIDSIHKAVCRKS